MPSVRHLVLVVRGVSHVLESSFAYGHLSYTENLSQLQINSCEASFITQPTSLGGGFWGEEMYKNHFKYLEYKNFPSIICYGSHFQ
jgi:hypothetical protein